MLRVSRDFATKQVIKETELWKFPDNTDYNVEGYNFDTGGCYVLNTIQADSFFKLFQSKAIYCIH